ncbi:hypothetical protein L226DRAFT_514216, partial [Lentinus tigrinus ALCF2SS1-7]
MTSSPVPTEESPPSATLTEFGMARTQDLSVGLAIETQNAELTQSAGRRTKDEGRRSEERSTLSRVEVPPRHRNIDHEDAREPTRLRLVRWAGRPAGGMDPPKRPPQTTRLAAQGFSTVPAQNSSTPSVRSRVPSPTSATKLILMISIHFFAVHRHGADRQRSSEPQPRGSWRCGLRSVDMSKSVRTNGRKLRVKSCRLDVTLRRAASGEGLPSR